MAPWTDISLGTRECSYAAGMRHTWQVAIAHEQLQWDWVSTGVTLYAGKQARGKDGAHRREDSCTDGCHNGREMSRERTKHLQEGRGMGEGVGESKVSSGKGQKMVLFGS